MGGYVEFEKEDFVTEIKRLRAVNEQLRMLLEKSKRKIKSERDFLFLLIDSIPAYIYLQRKDYSIQYANRVFYELFGEFEMKPCYKVIHKRDKPCEVCKTFIVFETKKPQQWLYYNKNGTIFRIYDYPFVDDRGCELVLEMGIDITPYQKYEDSRSNLFANISHELRTPLAKIMGYAESLKDGLYSAEEDHEKVIDCIYNNSVSLNRLINNLFELSRLETVHDVELSRVNLYNALSDFCEEQKYYFMNKDQIFEYSISDALPFVFANTNRMIQVFENIIENAIRYTGKGDVISLHAFRVNNNLLIKISDSGIGIRKEDLKYIFDRFYQRANNSNSKTHGGLGLHICKTIIDQLHGKLSVESEEGKGTTFYIKIPECEDNATKA